MKGEKFLIMLSYDEVSSSDKSIQISASSVVLEWSQRKKQFLKGETKLGNFFNFSSPY